MRHVVARTLLVLCLLPIGALISPGNGVGIAEPIITTIAGGGTGKSGPFAIEFGGADVMAFDSAGTLFLEGSTIGGSKRLDQDGTYSTNEDAAQFRSLVGAFGPDLAYYSSAHHQILKEAPSQAPQVIAGGETVGDSGDGGLAVDALLWSSGPIAVAPDGDVYFAQQGFSVLFGLLPTSVRAIDSSTGVISRVAGTDAPGSSGDGGPALAASIDPTSLAVTGDALYILDGFTAIRKVDLASGAISTIAGTYGVPGNVGNGGPAVGATICASRIWAAPDGSILLAQSESIKLNSATCPPVLRRIGLDGVVRVVAGSGVLGMPADGADALSAPLGTVTALATGPTGSIVFSTTAEAEPPEWRHRVSALFQITPQGKLEHIFGRTTPPASDGMVANDAFLFSASSVAVNSIGTVAFIEAGAGMRTISPNGALDTLTPPSASFSLWGPSGFDDLQWNSGFDVDGYLYATSNGQYSLLGLTTEAGALLSAFGIAGKVSPTGAQTNLPIGLLFRIEGATAVSLALSPNGTVYVNRYRCDVTVDPCARTAPDLVTVSQTGELSQVRVLDHAVRPLRAADNAGNVFFADGNRVMRWGTDNTVTVVAGNGTSGFSGDGGSATAAAFSTPGAMATDGAGNLYIADSGRVRKVTPGGIVTTVAGNGTATHSGDGGPATQAGLGNVRGLAVDSTGALFIAADVPNGSGGATKGVIRKVVAAGTPDPDPVDPDQEAGYSPVVPARLLETRSGPGLATVDGQFYGIGMRGAGTVTELQVTGRAGVPADATAVVLNVTVTEAQAPGFVTVYPCGSSRPNAASLNYVAGSTIPNAVIAKVGTGGKVCLFTLAATHLIADVNGFDPALSAYEALVPARLLETRSGPGLATVDGQFYGIGVRGAGTVTELQVTGRAGVPADATAVVLNVTVTEAQAPGFVTVYPCGSSRPNAASLNYVAGSTIPNAVIAKVGAGGKVCLYALAGTHLVADVNGYYPAGSAYKPLSPARLLETRSGPGLATVDGQFYGIGVRGAGTVTELQVTGRAGVPADATAVVLNVTVTEAQAPGFVTAYPCGASRPNAANLNYDVGTTIPNAVIVKVGNSGKVCLYTLATTHVVADINGYHPSATS